MLRNTHRRAGLSLMEALVALFIMAIGMISLLTLFPLGAIQMGRALRDDRCAQCAWQADGVVRAWWQTEVVDKPTEAQITAPYFAPLETGVTLPAGPSKVVAIDPIGSFAASGIYQKVLCGSSPIARANAGQTATQPAALRACSLVDDVFFTEAGTPDGSGNAKITRQGYYNWLALVQRPVNSQRTTANLKILVFDGRPPGSDPSSSRAERIVPLSPSAGSGSTQITIPMLSSNPDFPPIGRGGWVLDAGGDGTANNPYRMDFYRVQSITDTAAGSAVLELDTPIKQYGVAPNYQPLTQVIVLRGLAEVFDRPTLTPTAGFKPPTP